jgi:crotonobetainyl-CoA:carnitine CoA-transferase CaiB-like acyl-CoA transferase
MAGPLAAMILADYGADVIRLEPPGGDPMWEHPAYMVWQRGKRSVNVDWDSAAGGDAARRLIEGADVLIETLAPGRAAQLGIAYDDLKAANPALIYYSLSAFGQEGPYRDYKPCDGVINAKSGRMRDQAGWQKNRPTFRAINDISFHSAMFGLQAIIAALRVRSETGRGQRLEGTMLSGVSAPNNIWRLFEGQEIPPDLYPGELSKAAVTRGELTADRHESDPYTANPSQMCMEARDGRWVMHSHIQRDLFKSWINAIGFGWIWDDARYRDAPDFARDEDRIALNLQIFEHFRTRTADEWREIYRQHPDCAGETMQTTQEAIRHEQFLANGFLVETDDPRVGPIKQAGAIAIMSVTPAVIARPAPLPGQHTEEVLGEAPRAAPAIVPLGGKPSAPLEGIVVLECASWLAGPFSGALLADLGATVIKVEPLTGDAFRRMTNNENMVRSFQGKENLALNLKSKEGLAIFHDLVRKADVVMHNFRLGVPERLGIDYPTLSAIKPDLVYVCAASYGTAGPDRFRAAFNPTMGAFSGNSVFQSGEGNVPKGDQSPDPIAGSGVATGIMLGLAARVLTGVGQYVETSMMMSNILCNSDDSFDYQGKPPRRVPDKAQLGLEATYRLYETASGWIFVAAQFDAEFARLCHVLDREDLLGDPHYATWRGRIDHRHELETALEPVFRTRTADEWEPLLRAADVGCARADATSHLRFLHSNPHTTATGFMVPAQSPEFLDRSLAGRYWRHSPTVKFSDTPCLTGLPYRGLGSHTREVLMRLGLSGDKVDELVARKVVSVSAVDQDQQSG